jgi:hypothetical protein
MYVLVFVVIALGSLPFFLNAYEKATIVSVPEGSVAWDGETAFPAGDHSIVHRYELVDIEPRITTFGVDVLGLVSVIDTAADESGSGTEEGQSEKGYFSKHVSSGKSGSQTVTTRQSAEFKHRYIIVWQPDVDRIRQYLKAGNVPARLAELLRTMPDLDLEEYTDTLGIEIVSIQKPEKKKTIDSIEVADGAEIPY